MKLFAGFTLSFLFLGLLVITAGATTNPNSEDCTFSPVEQHEAFLQQYGNVVILNDYNEKKPCRFVTDAALEWVNAVNNLKGVQRATLDSMKLGNDVYLICQVDNRNPMISYLHPPVDYGVFMSESDEQILPCTGHKAIVAEYNEFDFNAIQDFHFRDYVKSLSEFQCYIEPTNDPTRHMICFGGYDINGEHVMFTSYIVTT